MRLTVLTVLAIVLFASQAAFAEKVSGKVTVTSELREAVAKKEKEASKKLYYWNEPNGIAAVRPPRVSPSSDIGVVLTLEGGASPGPNNVETVKVFAGSLEKDVIVTRPGSTIKFKNVDPFDHSLYSPTIASFKPEQQAKGGVRAIEFAEEGVFEIRCKLFPHFRAYVVVTKATHVVPVSGDGTFAVSELAPGKYQLKVFHDGNWIHTETVGVGGDKPREAKLNISLKPTAKPAAPPAAEKKTGDKDGDNESGAK